MPFPPAFSPSHRVRAFQITALACLCRASTRSISWSTANARTSGRWTSSRGKTTPVIRLQSKMLFSATLNAGDDIVTGQFTCRGKHHIWLNAEKAGDVANSYIVRGKHNPGHILLVTLGGQGWGVDDSPESNGVTTVDAISDTRFTVAASVNQTPPPDVYNITAAGECLPVEE